MHNAITKGLILNISSNPDVYTRGERYYRDGNILSLEASGKEDGISLIKAKVEGNYKNYEVTLWLEPNGALRQYVCTCESHSIWRGACKHVVAALFALMEGRSDVLASDRAQQAARTLTDALEKLIIEDIDASLAASGPPAASSVRLAPCFHHDNRGEAYLTFTVGYNRMYIVKSIPTFLMNIKHDETVSYGAGLKFCHTLSAFDEESRNLIHFMQQEEGLYNEMAKRMSKQYSHTYNARGNARMLPLTERNMDEFFDLYENTEIDAEIETPVRVLLQSAVPDIRLFITHEPTKSTITAEAFNFRFMHGQRFHYLISSNAIHRMGKADAQIIVNILRVLTSSTEKNIEFAGNEQKRFLSIILPKLKKLGIISGVIGEPPAGQATDMHTKLYFDSDKRDVNGRVAFVYGETVIDPMENTAADVARDVAGEYAIKRRLHLLGFQENTARKQFTLTGNEAIYAFLNGSSEDGGQCAPGIESLKDCAEVFVSDALHHKTIKVKSPTVGVRLQGNLLDVTLEDSGYSLNELLDALEAYRAKKTFHRLKDGRFLPLDDEGVGQMAELFDALDASKKEVHGNTLTMPAYRAMYVDELTRKDEMATAVNRNENFNKLVSDFKNNDELHFQVPDKLDSILRAYQKTGFQWLKTLAHYGFGGILADDMGLGKTIQVIALLLSEQKPGTRSLVVAPTSLLYNWESEIRRFAPELNPVVVSGLPEKRRELLLNQEADLFITTYDMMKRDTSAYASLEFEYLIADEAQNIKNPTTQNAKAIKEIRARVRLALTGTPIENALTELWSIFDFIMPGYLYSSHKFSRLYEYPIVKDNDSDRAKRLRQQISPFVLRRIKKNVLTELPDKTETTLLAELAPEQKKIYLANLLRAKGEFEDMTQNGAFQEGRMRILAQLTRLRQICCHPSLFVENYKGGSGKLDLALETIQMTVESGHRILLFSQFTTMLALLRGALEETVFQYFYLDGSTKAQDRMDMTSRFNKGERDLFLISLKAGGTGLNLTGADVVMHYDPWWNPSVMDQASDRAHRYGQEKAVQIFNLVAKDTIEEKIMALQDKKRDLIDSVITEGGSFINTLTEDEVRALFM